MDETLLFTIFVVSCLGTCIASTKKVSGVDVSISQTEIANYTPVDTAVNNEFHFNGSELEAARADECKCKNGKCMRVCDVEKTTPCVNQTKVCVCNPEFGKTSDNECEYCDCGQGFNCTFTRDGLRTAICICPEGYYKDLNISNSKCKRECSVERPCQNGGTCSNKKCNCLRGKKGDLCQEIEDCSSKCENRLEVDCLYNEQYQIAYCSCKKKAFFYDQEANICKRCPCKNGFCKYEYTDVDRKLVCHCFQKYELFNGSCKRCDCGYNVNTPCEFDSKGEKICNCKFGYFLREGYCEPCKCYGFAVQDTKCEVTDNVKQCFCQEGFEDNNGKCEDINECETNNTCHPSAICHNKFGSFECECLKGYRGYNGTIVKAAEVCEDINECKELKNACSYGSNVKCVNLPGSYKCECLQRYEPSSYSDEPHKTTCIQKTQWRSASIALGVILSAGIIGFGSYVFYRRKGCQR